MAKSSKLSDNTSTTTHFIQELFHAENEKQPFKQQDYESNHKQHNDKKKEDEKLFKDEDYILEIDKKFKAINKDNFLKYLEDIIRNIVEKKNYNDLEYFKNFNKKNDTTKLEANIVKPIDVDNSDNKEQNVSDSSKENDSNLTGNLLDIDG